jgi:hypothetical protein
MLGRPNIFRCPNTSECKHFRVCFRNKLIYEVE